MKTVSDIIRHKGAKIWHISPDETVYNAIALMAEKNIGALLVIHQDELRGILSERDYARKVILAGRSSKETRVREIMTPKLVCVTPSEPIERCMTTMTRRRIRHLPVVEGGELLGIISIGDVVKAVINEQEFVIEQLEYYITHS